MRYLIASLVIVAAAHLSVMPVQAASKKPTHVVVSLNDQRLTVYSGTEVITSSRASSGKSGHATPTGIFSIIQKRRQHFSNIYDNAPMPNMQRLTWSGIALHGSGYVPRYPASHGCVRLPHKFSRKLYNMTRMGAHVVVARDDIAPRPIYHTNLFQPQRADANLFASLRGAEGADVDLAQEPVTKKNTAPLRIFITRDAALNPVLDVQKMLNTLGWAAGDEDGFMGRNTRDAIKRYQGLIGAEQTGAISKPLIKMLQKATGQDDKPNGRVFVRQNFKPIFEAEVRISEPEKPLGAHLISATRTRGDSDQLEWVSLSLKDRLTKREAKRMGVTYSDVAERQSVTSVLSRIEMDATVRSTIDDLITKGSSISISDKGITSETSPGAGTDFIVLTRS